MNRRKALLSLAVVLLVAPLAVLLWRGPAEPTAAPPSSPSDARGTQTSSAHPHRPTLAPLAPPGEEGEDPPRSGEDMVAALRSRYGARIHQPHTQMRMLERLMRHFQRLNPSGWEADLLALVKQAFPELYDELALRLHQRVEYERWTREHQAELNAQTPEDRRAAVLAERNALFGKDVADQIWSAELRSVAVSDALKTIDALPQASVNERMAQYKESITQAYGDHAPAYTQAHQQELMDHFLDLGSVQKDLAGMTAEQREAQLRSIRKDMGLDDEAQARWTQLDAQRDARWAMGEQYMAERQQLTQRYSGAELEAQLSQLRLRDFPDEAQTLADEEASGFFRFSQPRQWGKN